MKGIKRILSLFLTLGIICTLIAVPVSAEATGELKGDCKILVHDTTPVKVPYMLYDSTGTAATAVTYALNGDANIGTYAKIDSATGDLYVSPKAKGKSFSVTATGTGSDSTAVSDSVAVEVLSTAYCTDFDDETGATVTNPMFKTNTAQVVDVGNGGKAAFAPTTEIGSPGLTLNLPENMSMWNYTITGDYMITTGGKTDRLFYGSTAEDENPRYIYGITSGEYLASIFRKDSTGATDSTNRVAIRISSATRDTKDSATFAAYYGGKTGWSQGADAVYDKYLPFSMTITNGNYILGRYYNSTTGTATQISKTGNIVDSSNNVIDFSSISHIGFGGYIDNLKVYSGTLAASAEFDAEYKIEGDSNIARAPIGTTANVSYELAPNMEGITVPTSGVKWSLKEAYSGVSVNEDTGVVSINGAVEAGTFTVVATVDEDASEEKTVTILEKLSSYSSVYDAARMYLDFENQTKDSVLVSGTNSAGKQHDYCMTLTPQGRGPAGKAVAKEADGNKYASASGRLTWSSDGTSLVVGLSNNSYDEMAADKFTIEGKFMAESTNKELMKNAWNVMVIPTAYNNHNPLYLDLRYQWLTDDVIGIYNYLNDEGTAFDEENAELIAVKKTDEWFNVRAEISNGKYSVYVDDVLVINNETTALPNLGPILIGAAVDDLAVYTGSKSATVKKANDIYAFADGEKMSASLAQKITYAEAKEGSSFAAAIMDSEDYDGATIITALYSATNKLIDIKYGPVEKSAAGISLGYSTVSGDVPKDGYAKIFIWEMDALTPVK